MYFWAKNQKVRKKYSFCDFCSFCAQNCNFGWWILGIGNHHILWFILVNFWEQDCPIIFDTKIPFCPGVEFHGRKGLCFPIYLMQPGSAVIIWRQIWNSHGRFFGGKNRRFWKFWNATAKHFQIDHGQTNFCPELPLLAGAGRYARSGVKGLGALNLRSLRFCAIYKYIHLPPDWCSVIESNHSLCIEFFW